MDQQLDQESTELSALFLRYYALLRASTDPETRVVVANLIHALEGRLAQLGVVPPVRSAPPLPGPRASRPD